MNIKNNLCSLPFINLVFIIFGPARSRMEFPALAWIVECWRLDLAQHGRGRGRWLGSEPPWPPGGREGARGVKLRPGETQRRGRPKGQARCWQGPCLPGRSPTFTGARPKACTRLAPAVCDPLQSCLFYFFVINYVAGSSGE